MAIQKKDANASLKNMLKQDNIKVRFDEILKDKAAGFVANLSVLVNSSTALSKCDPVSVISAAIISASLDLPIDPNLGFSAIVPFKDKATFQIMYKGLIQLAMRSAQYKTIHVSAVHDGELISENQILGEFEFDPIEDFGTFTLTIDESCELTIEVSYEY